MHSSTAVPEWWSNEAKTPIWRRQINKRISCFRLRWLFRAAQRGLGRICFGGSLLSRPWGCMGLCDCSFGGHQVLLSSTESLGGVPNKSLGLALVVTLSWSGGYVCGAGGGSRESRARAGVCGVGNWQLGRGFHTLAFSGFSCLFLSFLGLFFSFSFPFLVFSFPFLFF